MRSLEDYGVVADLLKRLYVDEVHISPLSDDLREVLAQHPKLVVVSNHGPMWGALAGIIGLADTFRHHGGARRRPFGITWRAFYELPVTRQIFQYITQARHPQHFEDALLKLNSARYDDCIIMPEGENCNFGNGFDIQPFVSPRFVELALLARVPILVMVHQGAESWAWPVQVPNSLLPLLRWLPDNLRSRLAEEHRLSVPKPFKPKLRRLSLAFRLYKPSLRRNWLAQDAKTRQEQLEKEASRVRGLMQDLVQKLAREPLA